VSVRQKKNNDEETVSDYEIWSTIRYLDPDAHTTASNIAVVVTLIAIFSMCLACIVLHLREINATESYERAFYKN
jgi:hypothetical protein